VEPALTSTVFLIIPVIP